MTNPLLKFRVVSDWLDDRKARRQLRRLNEEYALLVKQAEGKKDWDEHGRLLAEWGFEEDSILHPVHARNAEKLTAKARRYGITVPPQPTSYGQDSDDWYPSQVYGFWLLTRQTERKIQREVRDEQRAAYDEFRKWSTMAFAFLAFVLGLISLLVKQKQPDPCPQNYYRSNSGECVFALDKTAGQHDKR
jgi:hypothetical protein